MAGGWFIENGLTKRRWNRLSGSWAIWIWGSDYPSRKAAEEEAVFLAARFPHLIGVIKVEEAAKWPTRSRS